MTRFRPQTAGVRRLHAVRRAAETAEPGEHGERPAPGCVAHVRGRPQDRGGGVRRCGPACSPRRRRLAVSLTGAGSSSSAVRRGTGRGAVAQCGHGRGGRREQGRDAGHLAPACARFGLPGSSRCADAVQRGGDLGGDGVLHHLASAVDLGRRPDPGPAQAAAGGLGRRWPAMTCPVRSPAATGLASLRRLARALPDRLVAAVVALRSVFVRAMETSGCCVRFPPCPQSVTSIMHLGGAPPHRGRRPWPAAVPRSARR